MKLAAGLLAILLLPPLCRPVAGAAPDAAAADGADGGLAVVLRGEGEHEAAPHGQGNVYAPEVLVDEHGVHRLWYGGQGKDGHDRILYAESRDGGRRWERRGVAVEDPSANHVNDPSVVKVNGTCFMFFTRAKKDVLDEVGLATSADGLRWEMKGTVLEPGAEGEWDSLSVGRPSVLHEGGLFHMWYDGRKDFPPGAPVKDVPKSPAATRSVGYATSPDGLKWTRHRGNPVFGNGAGAVDVRRVADGYVMLYESHEGTRAATSGDGIRWRDRGLWLAKSGGGGKRGTDDPPDAHGHVTPHLLLTPGGGDGRAAVLYFGAAAAASWDRNAVAAWAVRPAAWERLTGCREGE